MTEVSSTRLYLGNLPRNGQSMIPFVLICNRCQYLPTNLHSSYTFTHLDLLTCSTATKTQVQEHFETHGTGEITEIKLMNGFGFIEYKDPMDARDVVPGRLTNSSPAEYILTSFTSKPSTVPTLWANVLPYNLLEVLAIVMRLLLLSVPPPVPDVHLIACRSLDFHQRPVGRSVPPIPSSGLMDLTTCYLDTEQQHIWTASLYTNPF
jgi:hypothetical protein